MEQAKEGDGQVVLLSGEPGIGKSRIVQELRDRLSDELHTRLSHYCSQYHTSSPLYPVISLLERAADFDRRDTTEAKLNKLEALLARSATDVREAAGLLGGGARDSDRAPLSPSGAYTTTPEATYARGPSRPACGLGRAA